jgi:hypothetical protein
VKERRRKGKEKKKNNGQFSVFLNNNISLLSKVIRNSSRDSSILRMARSRDKANIRRKRKKTKEKRQKGERKKTKKNEESFPLWSLDLLIS